MNKAMNFLEEISKDTTAVFWLRIFLYGVAGPFVVWHIIHGIVLLIKHIWTIINSYADDPNDIEQ